MPHKKYNPVQYYFQRPMKNNTLFGKVLQEVLTQTCSQDHLKKIMKNLIKSRALRKYIKAFSERCEESSSF